MHEGTRLKWRAQGKKPKQVLKAIFNRLVALYHPPRTPSAKVRHRTQLKVFQVNGLVDYAMAVKQISDLSPVDKVAVTDVGSDYIILDVTYSGSSVSFKNALASDKLLQRFLITSHMGKKQAHVVIENEGASSIGSSA